MPISEPQSARLQTISIAELREKVSQELSAGPSRYYMAMLNRLEEYLGSDQLDPEAVTPAFVKGFNQFLLSKGSAISTLKLYRNALRAILRPIFGIERKERLKEAFASDKDIDRATTHEIRFEDIKRLSLRRPARDPELARIRDIFLYAVISGGLNLNELKTCANSEFADQDIPLQRRMRELFRLRHPRNIGFYINKLTPSKYARDLERLARFYKFPALGESSAADCWITLARKSNVEVCKIASVLPSGHPFANQISYKPELEAEERRSILGRVADTIHDMRPRWYVLRLGKKADENLIAAIGAKISAEPGESFRRFRVPEADAGSPANGRKGLMDSLIFVQCTTWGALRLRHLLDNRARIYTFMGSDVPAYISDKEMRTFMLLCDLSGDTLQCYFPDREEVHPGLNPGHMARISKGNLKGQVGIINAVSPDRYKVVLRFESIGGARIEAEVPVEFLEMNIDHGAETL